jgi:hypothetical protein
MAHITNTIDMLLQPKNIQCLVDLELPDGSSVRVQVFHSQRIAFSDGIDHDFLINRMAVDLDQGIDYTLTDKDEEAVGDTLWQELHGGAVFGIIRGSLVK